jgi:hypothetical protein
MQTIQNTDEEIIKGGKLIDSIDNFVPAHESSYQIGF